LSGNLPVRLTSFVGRRRELDELATVLDAARLVTLTGPGGAGKTSLAIELAREIADRFPDGSWFVPLDRVLDRDLVAPAIATAFGLVESGGSAPERLHAFLADRSLLLVLDNLEQVRAAAPLVNELLHGAPGVRILVTSRAPLRLSAEQEFAVLPLPLPGPDDDAASSDCVQLFADRARRVQRGFAVTAENVAAVTGICRRLEGLPLGIELAAGRVGLLPPATIAERIGRRLDLPGSGPRDLPERQHTLHAAIGWSHDLLDVEARRLFARLAVFAGGCRLEEAEAVCGADPGIGDVLEGLSALVEQSLVQSSVGLDGPRFSILEPVRLFAAERLAEAGETESLRRRHASAYLALAEASQAFVPGRDQVAWLQRLGADHDNLRAALRWAIESGDAEVGLRMTAALWRYWQLAGHLEEAVSIGPEVLAMAGAEAPTTWRLQALDAVGGIFYWRAEHARAAELYREQLELAEAIGDRRAIADATFNLAFPVGLADGLAQAEAMLTEAAGIYAELGDEAARARTEWSIAADIQIAGRTEISLPMLDAAVERFRELDDLPYVALALSSVSLAHMRLGNLPEALTRGFQSLLAYHTLGDRSTTSLSLHGAALIAGMLGLLEQAAVLEGAFEALSRRYGVRPPMALEAIFAWEEVARMADLLRSEAHAEARARGARMSLDEAVDFVARLAPEWAAKSEGPAIHHP
jgi:predicted ATPase